MIGLPNRYFQELVYDREAAIFFREWWPDAMFEDASDCIHEGRFQLTIIGVDRDECYPRIIVEGWAEVCLSFQMCLLMKEKHDDIRRWIDAAEVLKDAA